MKRIAIYAVFALLFCISSGGQSKVYFVHGLNDRDSVWTVYKNALVRPENQGRNFNWYSSSPLEYSASRLNSTIKYWDYADNAIVFGHSAGGLIAREAALQPGSKIRSIITAGTPNHGAGIVRAINDGTAQNLVTATAKKLYAAYLEGSAADEGLNTTLRKWARQVGIVIAGALTNTIVKELESKMDDFISSFTDCPAVQDMHPDNIKIADPTIPIINIYGKEDNKPLLRLLGAIKNRDMINDPGDTTDTVFDEDIFPIYKAAVATATTLEVFHYAMGATLALLGPFVPGSSMSSALHFTSAAHYSDTNRFLQYDVFNDWNDMIGAYHFETKSETTGWWFWAKTTYTTVKVYEDSDGFIPNNSSKMEESNEPYIRNIEVKGVNHLEMNRNTEMRKKLDNILNTNDYKKEFNPRNY